jgi:hypothetical protein
MGCGMFGTHAGEMIGEIALAIEMGVDAVDIGKTIHPNPSLRVDTARCPWLGCLWFGVCCPTSKRSAGRNSFSVRRMYSGSSAICRWRVSWCGLTRAAGKAQTTPTNAPPVGSTDRAYLRGAPAELPEERRGQMCIIGFIRFSADIQKTQHHIGDGVRCSAHSICMRASAMHCGFAIS